ncbi:MAG TPA: phosphoribosylformylglycinamidine synthase subunit PurQ, partial [Thermoleophilia bacterium]|nr:phosphoribosylformylglycinamidine synthase subunit PurQ [Thermoleophilia bacterium]
KHNEGNYTVAPETLARMRDNGQIVVRYVNAAGERAEGANPTGSLDDIAGVCNETHNVFGLMPHPENSVEAGLAGGADGRVFFQSMIDTLRSAEVRA